MGRGPVRTRADVADAVRRRLLLCDGGVYDNIGMQVVQSYETILVSDATAPPAIDPAGGHALIGAVISAATSGIRIVELLLSQIQARRKFELGDRAKARKSLGVKWAYWDIATAIDKYASMNPLVGDSDKTRALAGMRTRLNRFTPAEQRDLINWGYALADVTVRAWVDPTLAPPTRLPCA